MTSLSTGVWLLNALPVSRLPASLRGLKQALLNPKPRWLA